MNYYHFCYKKNAACKKDIMEFNHDN